MDEERTLDSWLNITPSDFAPSSTIGASQCRALTPSGRIFAGPCDYVGVDAEQEPLLDPDSNNMLRPGDVILCRVFQ